MLKSDQIVWNNTTSIPQIANTFMDEFVSCPRIILVVFQLLHQVSNPDF